MAIRLAPRADRKKARKEARARLRQAWRGVRLVSVEDWAEVRGLAARPRENSIFSDAWIPLAILFLLIGYLAGRNAPLLTLAAGLLLIVGVSTWWKNRALKGILMDRHLDRTHVFPGEPVQMTLTITNDKLLPLTWLQVKDELPIAPDSQDALTRAISETAGRYLLQYTLVMAGRQRLRRTVTLRFPARGYQRLGPSRLQSGDVFTLFTTEEERPDTATLVVYPEVLPMEKLALPAKELFGDVTVRRSLFTDPIKTQGIRDYQPGDRFRDVHWKATARRGSLQTKVYDPSTGLTVAVFLNVATLPHHWLGHFPPLLERAVSVAASLASYAVEQKWGVGVYANGAVPRSDQPIHVPPGRSPDQLMRILEALAAVSEFATGSIENLMRRESPRLPWAATLVLVTAIVTDEILVTLLRLKEAGRRVVL
ncbi:MAG: DUF58 domain-containing protein, partial [Chloroflexota bacterium]